MNESIIHFKKNGFPEIKLFEDYFEIKSIDYTKFRKFHFKDVKSIKYYDPNNNWYTKVLILFSNLMTFWAAQRKYRYLRIYKSNNGYWNYILPGKIDFDLVEMLNLIELKMDSVIVTISK